MYLGYSGVLSPVPCFLICRGGIEGVGEYFMGGESENHAGAHEKTSACQRSRQLRGLGRNFECGGEAVRCGGSFGGVRLRVKWAVEEKKQ